MSHNDVTRIFSLIISHNDDALGLSSRPLRNHVLHPHVSGKLMVPQPSPNHIPGLSIFVMLLLGRHKASPYYLFMPLIPP